MWHRRLAAVAVKYNQGDSTIAEFFGGSPVRDARLRNRRDLEDDPEGNVWHIAEHGLSIEEVEDVLLNRDAADVTSRRSGRAISFGWTATGRHIAVVWETISDDPRMVRVRTAYEVIPKRGKT